MPVPSVLPIMRGSENATMPTTTPITPQISAFFASLIFPASPCAAKNKIPATINIITEKPTNIGHIIAIIAATTAAGLPITPGMPKATAGTTKKMINDNKKDVLLFMQMYR